MQPDIVEEFEDWSLYARTNSKGDIVNLYSGSTKNEDGFRMLFHLIAPYVEDGSYIMMVGEDGRYWMFLYDGGKCTELENPKLQVA